jgi:hypothetical protein
MYADPVYRRIRREILASKPICVFPGCTKVVDTLDHVRPVDWEAETTARTFGRCAAATTRTSVGTSATR